MALVTLRVVDGSDRGRTFGQLPTPVTIGREEGNTIQLNDDRVSRYHVKIQEDHDRLVLTDLESTNGTKVNGDDVQLRILRVGDMITVGRSVLLFGSRNEIEDQMRQAADMAATIDPDDHAAVTGRSLDFDLHLHPELASHATLHQFAPPELPERMTPGQAAQLAELIEYVHARIRRILTSVQMDEGPDRIEVDAVSWQNLLDLQARLSEYLRQIGEPDSTLE